MAKGKVDAVLTMGVDRISRKMEAAFHYLDFLEQHGVRLITDKDGPVDMSIHRVLFGAVKR